MNKEKYLQIFNYLLEFSKLRSKSVRDIRSSSQYTDIIWFSDIPTNENISCVTHNNLSDNDEYWLKISKPTEPVKPVFPDPPKNLEEWIIKDSLLNKDDLPELYSTIIINGQIESIENHPEIIKGFDEYCENTWFINAERYWKAYNQYETLYTIYDRVNTLYKKLFTIYNKSQQFGEEYELILGVGLKPLIEKYSFFKSLRPEITANSNREIVLIEGKYTVKKMIFDKKSNDYERFQTEVKGDKTKYYWSAFKKNESLFKN